MPEGDRDDSASPASDVPTGSPEKYDEPWPSDESESSASRPSAVHGDSPACRGRVPATAVQHTSMRHRVMPLVMLLIA